MAYLSDVLIRALIVRTVITLDREITSMLKLTHCLAYLALSGAYTGAGLGFDKTGVLWFTAFLYLVLAIEAWMRRKEHD